MTPLERAREFADGAFGPFGVDVEPYAKIIAELIEGAIEQELAEIERLRAENTVLRGCAIAAMDKLRAALEQARKE